jgi:hypothetical protein
VIVAEFLQDSENERSHPVAPLKSVELVHPSGVPDRTTTLKMGGRVHRDVASLA